MVRRRTLPTGIPARPWWLALILVLFRCVAVSLCLVRTLALRLVTVLWFIAFFWTITRRLLAECPASTVHSAQVALAPCALPT